jgi:hypothetical protein
MGLAWSQPIFFTAAATAAGQLPPDLRAPTAYVMGRRYLNQHKQPEQAAKFFEMALAAAPDTALHQLAKNALAQLGG